MTRTVCLSLALAGWLLAVWPTPSGLLSPPPLPSQAGCRQPEALPLAEETAVLGVTADGTVVGMKNSMGPAVRWQGKEVAL